MGLVGGSLTYSSTITGRNNEIVYVVIVGAYALPLGGGWDVVPPLAGPGLDSPPLKDRNPGDRPQGRRLAAAYASQ